MKHGNKHFMQVSRSIWDRGLSDNAILLFLWLNELEQRFTGGKVKFFFRSNEELATDMRWSLKTLKAAKAEILKQGDLLKSWQTHFVVEGKKSKKHVTAFQILK